MSHAAERLISERLTITFGQNTVYTVESACDAANRRTRMTYPDGSGPGSGVLAWTVVVEDGNMRLCHDDFRGSAWQSL